MVDRQKPPIIDDSVMFQSAPTMDDKPLDLTGIKERMNLPFGPPSPHTTDEVQALTDLRACIAEIERLQAKNEELRSQTG